MCAALSPDEWNDRRLDDLAAQVRVMAALATQVATNTANLSAQDDDIRWLRESQRELLASAEKMLGAIGDECRRNSAAVERKVDAQGGRLDKQAEKLEALTVAQRWTPKQWAAILGPALTALISAAALVLTSGSP